MALPSILQEAMERAGNGFAHWDEQAARTVTVAVCPLRMLRGRTWQRARESREERRI